MKLPFRAGLPLLLACWCAPLGCATDAPSPAKAAAGADAASAADGAVAAGQDAEAPDTAPDLRNQAWVFASDPSTDNDQVAQVTLRQPTTEDGFLTGAYVQVFNCLPEEGGAPMKQGKWTVGHMCHEVQTVQPDENGSYLQVMPPEDYAEAGDAFAEVQMYHHVNQIHDFFADKFGLHDLDYPLYALVNVTMQTLMAPGKWQGFQNAAFMPKEAFAQFGMPERDDGAIIFGQFQKTDFCYDSSVIYHEYTHAIVGTTRLVGVLVDQYGLDNLPGAMNEGFADYFSCSKRDSPIIGPYALTFGGDWLVRDLTKARKCPDDLWSEAHADGKIIGSAMWELRGVLGADQADQIILNALQQFSLQTNMDAAGKLILAEAKKVDADTYTKTQKVLANHGITGCIRAKEWQPFDPAKTEDKVTYSLVSKAAMGGSGGAQFPSGVPGYVQFWLQPPPGKGAAKVGITASTKNGFGTTLDLAFAVRKGKAVELNMFSKGEVLADELIAPKGSSKTAENQQFYITGACIAQGVKTYVMLLNPNNSELAVETMDITWYDAAPNGASAIDCVK